MRFIFDGEIYKAIKMTGSSHNMLGLSFIENNSSSNNLEIMPLKAKNDGSCNILAADVQEQVLAAIAEINAKFGVNYKARKIQFIPSDTPVLNIYKELTIELISRIIMKGKFAKTEGTQSEQHCRFVIANQH